MCCSMKDSSIQAMEKLMEKKGKFDYVLFETSGLADPAPIASMFWLDEGLESELILDGIVTVVDAQRCLKQLESENNSSTDDNNKDKNNDKPSTTTPHFNEAVRQIALADRIILNKTDLVQSDSNQPQSQQQQIEAIISTIKTINSAALIQQSVNSVVPIDFILNLGEFEASARAVRFLEEQGAYLEANSVHAPNATLSNNNSTSKYSSVTTTTINIDYLADGLVIKSKESIDQ